MGREAPSFDLCISAFVLGELQRGMYPGKADALALVRALPLLEVVPEVEEIASVYIARKLMPADDLGDAYHLAIVRQCGGSASSLRKWANRIEARNRRRVRRLECKAPE